MTPKWTKNLIFVQNNLSLLSKNSLKHNEKTTKLWEIAKDNFSMDDNEILDIGSLSMDELELETIFFSMKTTKYDLYFSI